MKIELRNILLLITALFATGLFSGCDLRREASSSDASIRGQWPHAAVYRVPERGLGYQYIITDTCGAVYFAETFALKDDASIAHSVRVVPCR